jgi:glycosyltransferase involved in cell wall biosynthesis
LFMKILQIVPYFLPYVGGQENYVYNLSKHLVEKGHEVHVVTSNYPKTSKEEVIDGITVTRYPCLARLLRNPITPSFFTLVDLAKEYDIIHTHNEHSTAAMAAAYLKKRTGKPLVLTCHGQLRFGNAFLDSIENVYSRTIGKKILEKTDAIITLSGSDKQYITSLGIRQDKIAEIPNAIDTHQRAMLEKNSDPEGFRKKYALEGKRIVLYVGQVIQRKGLEYLINAMPQVIKDNGEDIHFVYVGEGDYLQTAKKMIEKLDMKKHATFTGSLNQQDVASAYKAAELYILPSLSEGLPTTILEAMYYGVPVIATDIPGVRDHFEGAAVLIPLKSTSRIADALSKTISDKDLIDNLVARGKTLVLSKYTWPEVTNQYECVSKTLLP